MKKSAEEAALNSEKLLTLLKELNEGNNTRLKEMMAEAQKQSRQQQELLMQQIERNNSNYIAMFQKLNEQYNKQQAHIMKGISVGNRPVIGGGGGCTLFWVISQVIIRFIINLSLIKWRNNIENFVSLFII